MCLPPSFVKELYRQVSQFGAMSLTQPLQAILTISSTAPMVFPPCHFSFLILTHNSAGELPLVFNDPYMDLVSGFTASEQLVSNQVVNYWTNFHRTGNPNLGTAATPVNWPRYSHPAGASLMIQSAYTTVNNWNQAFDTFWTPLLAPNCEY